MTQRHSLCHRPRVGAFERSSWASEQFELSVPGCRAGGASVQNGRSYTNRTPSPLLCSSDSGEGPKNSVGVSFTTFPGERPKSSGGISRQRGIFTFWLSLSPLTLRGPLNFFLLAKFHCGVGAVEGREETWRKTEKECGVCRDPKRPVLGITAFGHQHTLSRLRHRCSLTRTYASASQTISFREILAPYPSSISPRTKRLGPDPSTLTCGLHLPGGGAPGPSRGGRGRSPARRAPSNRRAGQGALENGRVLPHFHPRLPCGAGGGVSTQAQSRLAEAAA